MERGAGLVFISLKKELGNISKKKWTPSFHVYRISIYVKITNNVCEMSEMRSKFKNATFFHDSTEYFIFDMTMSK